MTSTLISLRVADKNAPDGRAWLENVPGHALPSNPQLVAHLSPREPGWAITHRPSGLAIMCGIHSKDDAMVALHLLDEAPVPWATPANVLANDPIAIEHVQAAARRLHAKMGV